MFRSSKGPLSFRFPTKSLYLFSFSPCMPCSTGFSFLHWILHLLIMLCIEFCFYLMVRFCQCVFYCASQSIRITEYLSFLNLICMLERNMKAHDWPFRLSWSDCKWVGPVPFFLCICVDIHYFCLVFVTIPPSLSLSVSPEDENIAEGYATRTKQVIRPISESIFPKLFNSLTSKAVYCIFPCRVIKVRMSWVHAWKLDSLIPMIQDTTSVKQVMECKRLIQRAFF